MGFLDNLTRQFVEVEEETTEVDVRTEDNVEESAVSTTIPATISEDIVSEAYKRFANSSINVFIVEELAKNLEGIPEEARNRMLCKNLITMGHDILQYRSELQQRKEEISNVSKKQKSACEAKCADIDSKIADAKKLIDDLSKEKLDLQNKLHAASAGAENKLKRLEDINIILGGAE